MASTQGTNVHYQIHNYDESSWPRHTEHPRFDPPAPCDTPFQESFTRPKKQLLTKGQARTKGLGGQCRRCVVVAKEGIVTFVKEFPDSAAKAKGRVAEAWHYELPHARRHAYKQACWYVEDAVDRTTKNYKAAEQKFKVAEQKFKVVEHNFEVMERYVCNVGESSGTA